MKKIFKTSGSKGLSLALVILLTGMITALSAPVFAENTPLEQSLIDAGILQADANGNPVRTNPPDVDSVIDSVFDIGAPFDIFDTDDTLNLYQYQLTIVGSATGGDPDSITSNAENTLTEAGGGTTSTTTTTTTTTAEETATTTEAETTTTTSTSCSSGEHFHSGFGCEANH